MADKLPIPNFANESEEAEWWYDNRDKLDLYLEKGEPRTIHEVLAGHGLVLDANAITLSLQDGDLHLAWKQAETRGVDHKKYLADLLHEALHAKAA